MALWGGLAAGGATGANKALQLRRQQQQFQQQSDYRNQVLDESMRSNRDRRAVTRTPDTVAVVGEHGEIVWVGDRGRRRFCKRS